MKAGNDGENVLFGGNYVVNVRALVCDRVDPCVKAIGYPWCHCDPFLLGDLLKSGYPPGISVDSNYKTGGVKTRFRANSGSIRIREELSYDNSIGDDLPGRMKHGW